MNNKILVTGGAGFIGSHLVDAYIEDGYDVAILDNFSTGLKENVNSDAELYEGDIRNKDFVQKTLRDFNPQIINHQAAHISVPESIENPDFNAEVNVLGTLNILETAKETDVEKIIAASSGGAIYGEEAEVPTSETESPNPESPYGISKMVMEKYLAYYGNQFDMDWVALRYSNVYGPRQGTAEETSVVDIFIKRMMNGEQPYIFGDGKQTRDFVFVEDIVRANKLAEEKGKGVYNIGTGKETDITTLFNLIKENTGSDLNKEHKPSRKGEQRRSALDFSKARKGLGWAPKTSLEEGLEKTITYFE